MSDRAEATGPAARRRKTTVTGGVKQANGSKSNGAGDKPAQYTGKVNAGDELHNHANKNGKVGRETGQLQLTNGQRKQRSVAEDINEKLRYRPENHVTLVSGGSASVF